MDFRKDKNGEIHKWSSPFVLRLEIYVTDL